MTFNVDGSNRKWPRSGGCVILKSNFNSASDCFLLIFCNKVFTGNNLAGKILPSLRILNYSQSF